MPQEPNKKSSININPVTLRRYYHSLDPLLTKPKNRAYTTTILSFLVVSLFLWYAIKPTMQTILSLRREIRDNMEVNAQMEEKISKLVEAQAIYQTISEEAPGKPAKLSYLREAIPPDPDLISFLIQLRNLATSVAASISGIQTPSAQLDSGERLPGSRKNTDIDSIPLTVEVAGQYTNIKAFLDGLMDMRRFVTLRMITISPYGELKTMDKANPILHMVMKMNAQYVLPAKQAQ